MVLRTLLINKIAKLTRSAKCSTEWRIRFIYFIEMVKVKIRCLKFLIYFWYIFWRSRSAHLFYPNDLLYVSLLKTCWHWFFPKFDLDLKIKRFSQKCMRKTIFVLMQENKCLNFPSFEQNITFGQILHVSEILSFLNAICCLLITEKPPTKYNV